MSWTERRRGSPAPAILRNGGFREGGGGRRTGNGVVSQPPPFLQFLRALSSYFRPENVGKSTFLFRCCHVHCCLVVRCSQSPVPGHLPLTRGSQNCITLFFRPPLFITSLVSAVATTYIHSANWTPPLTGSAFLMRRPAVMSPPSTSSALLLLRKSNSSGASEVHAEYAGKCKKRPR